MSIFLQENQLTICNLSEVEHIVSNKNFQYHEHVQFNIQTKAMIFKDSWQIYKKKPNFDCLQGMTFLPTIF